MEEEPYFCLLFQFTFAKMWLLFAQFEIRQKNLQAARKIMVRLLTLTVPGLLTKGEVTSLWLCLTGDGNWKVSQEQAAEGLH